MEAYRHKDTSRSLPRGSSEHNANVVLAVHNERDIRISRQHSAIKFSQRHATAHMVRIFHRDVIGRRMIPETNRVSRPVARNARIDGERGTAQAETEHPLHTGPVEPASCPAVPGPSPASYMWGLAVHVAGDDVRLDFVALNIRSRRDSINRIQHAEQ